VLCQNLHSCLWDAASPVYKHGSCRHRSRRSKEKSHFLFKTNSLKCRVPAHHWDISQSLLPSTAVPLPAPSIGCCRLCAEGAEVQPLTGFVSVASICILAKHFQLLICSPFQSGLRVGEKAGKDEVLQMLLRRECIANALKWTFILH